MCFTSTWSLWVPHSAQLIVLPASPHLLRTCGNGSMVVYTFFFVRIPCMHTLRYCRYIPLEWFFALGVGCPSAMAIGSRESHGGDGLSVTESPAECESQAGLRRCGLLNLPISRHQKTTWASGLHATLRFSASILIFSRASLLVVIVTLIRIVMEVLEIFLT